MIVKRLINAVKRRLRHLTVLVNARKHSLRTIEKRRGNNILVLCYGNIYRSPLLAYLLKKNDSLNLLRIKSSGFHNNVGRPCEDSYVSLLAGRGYDLSGHRSSLVSGKDLNWADVIVIMDRKNWDMLSELDRKALQKTIWVGGLTQQGSVEIEDPYGRGQKDTMAIIAQLEQCSHLISRALKSLNAPKLS